MPFFQQLNFDLYTLTPEQLEVKRINAKEASRKRAEDKKKYHGGEK